MKRTHLRAAAGGALAVALTLGLSACNFFSPQTTLKKYDPSDGVGTQVGELELRNGLLVGEDERATLVLSIVNPTAEDAVLGLEYSSSATDAVGGSASIDVAVPARSTVQLDGTDPVVLEGIDAQLGGLFGVYFQSGDSEGELLELPVLDGTLAEYADLLPGPAPTPTPTPTVTVEPEPTPIPTPTEDVTDESPDEMDR